MKKKPYLLLETLIAIALLALCAVPILETPFRLFQKELSLLEDIELERLADIVFSEAYAKLCQRQWNWIELSEASSQKPLTFEFPKQEIYINKNKPLVLKPKYRAKIYCKKKNDASLLLSVNIRFWKTSAKKSPQKYQYLLWVQKKPVLSESR